MQKGRVKTGKRGRVIMGRGEGYGWVKREVYSGKRGRVMLGRGGRVMVGRGGFWEGKW